MLRHSICRYWSLRLLLTIWIALLQQYLVTRIGLNGYRSIEVAALPSAQRPGEMDPKTISLLIGDNATITCNLYDPNSSLIWFYEERSHRSIQQPSEYIKVLDPYTAVLFIYNADEQKSRYQCKIGAQAIGITELYVGEQPGNVSDFTCIVNDYELMECSFTKPRNMLLTHYTLEYRIGGDNEYLRKKFQEYDDDQEYYVCALQNEVDDKFYCTINEYYYPVRKRYIFKLTGRNDVGINVQYFYINNHKIVIPSAPEIKAISAGNNSVTIRWNKHNIVYYPKKLRYDVLIRDSNESDWFVPHWRQSDRCRNSTCQIFIDNLFSYWTYSLKIRAKSNVIEEDEGSEKMWSQPAIQNFRTLPSKPLKAPKVPLGAFYVDNTETQLRLYWEHINATYHNGPDFHYVILEMDAYHPENVINRYETNETTLLLSWKEDQNRFFHIKTANSLGESESSGFLRIYSRNGSRNSEKQYEIDDHSIAKIYHNNSYTLTWKAPLNSKDLLNYTVFWCLPKIELPNQCKGPIYFKYVNKYTTNYTTEPKDRSLNLAISANYESYNKGMTWAQCSGDISSELMKMEIDIEAVNKSSILVKWNSGSVCISILKGYNLTYWRSIADNNLLVMEEQKHDYTTIELLRSENEFRNYTINSLQPFSEICVTMFMYSTTKRGRSSDVQCIRTKAAAPSPPQNLRLVDNSLTSNSARITWEPPKVFNGILTQYSIYWRKNSQDVYDTLQIDANDTFLTLGSLNSFSSYDVYVSAHTIEESTPSNHINFSTLIGIPSNPRNLNITVNDSVISWDAPVLPSGRLGFYVVALVRRSNDSSEIIETVSVINTQNCRFHIPNCYSSLYSYTLKVRAVNMAWNNEYDHEIEPMTLNGTLGQGRVDQSFCKPNVNINFVSLVNGGNKANFHSDDERIFYFASPWSYSHQIYRCSGTPVFAYVVAIVMLGTVMFLLSFWLRRKYKEMKNIEVILPEGLVDQVSKYKFGQNIYPTVGSNELNSNSVNNNDFLTNNLPINNHYILKTIYKSSMNAFNFASSKILKENDSLELEKASLQFENEEVTSNSSLQSIEGEKQVSSTTSEATTASCTTDNLRQKTETEISVNDYDTNQVLYNSTVAGEGCGGYVTPNTLLLASTNVSNFNSGYIQVNSIKPSLKAMETSKKEESNCGNSDGYSTFEELQEMIRLNAIPKTLAEEIGEDTFNNKDFLDNRLENLYYNHSDKLNLESAQEENNGDNNGIYGYVTQEQLANFGTNVAMAKEVNY